MSKLSTDQNHTKSDVVLIYLPSNVIQHCTYEIKTMCGLNNLYFLKTVSVCILGDI